MKKIVLISSLLIIAVISTVVYILSNQSYIPPCQKESTTFTKSSDKKEMIKEGQKLIKNGNYAIEGELVEAKYMNSSLKEYASIETTTKEFKAIFPQNSNTPLFIKFKIYENDKLDPGKKSQSCKNFAGYVMFEFWLEDELLYKIQTDFIEPKSNDIKDRVECVADSFLAL